MHAAFNSLDLLGLLLRVMLGFFVFKGKLSARLRDDHCLQQ